MKNDNKNKLASLYMMCMIESGLVVSQEGDQFMFDFFCNAFELGMKSSNADWIKQNPELYGNLKEDLEKELELNKEVKKSNTH